MEGRGGEGRGGREGSRGLCILTFTYVRMYVPQQVPWNSGDLPSILLLHFSSMSFPTDGMMHENTHTNHKYTNRNTRTHVRHRKAKQV